MKMSLLKSVNCCRWTRGLLLGLVVLLFVKVDQSKGSLSVQKTRRSPEDSPLRIYNSNQEEDEDFVRRIGEGGGRDKRDVKAPASDSKIKTDVNVLPAWHNQLLVYWAGKDVIICLAKDSKPNSTSTLYVSQDYGGKFTNVTDQLQLKGKNPPALEKFFNHPKHTGLFVFTDIRNKYVYTTENFGKAFNGTEVSFVPDEILFDPVEPKTIIAYESSTKEKEMWVSQDYGVTWKKVQQHVKSVAWDESIIPPKLYLQREQPNGRSVIISSDSLFLDAKDTIVVLDDVDEFQIKDDYMFATKQKTNESLELLISYQHGAFLTAIFPSIQPTKHFHVADVSTDGQIFVCVVHNQSVSNLYIGSVPFDNTSSPKFSLSLERIVFFKPNVTWSESWLNDVTEEEFVDLHHVEGLRGVYIASQLKPSSTGKTKIHLDEVTSWITYDQGGEWEMLKPPEFDDDGHPIYCQYTSKKSGENCSLHISQQLSQLYPVYRAVPILSKKSAVGLILATGTVNTTLRGRLGVYLSTDGANSWRQLLQGNYLYGFGDHGGIIVATKYYRIGDATNELIYSIDEGETWQTYEFYKDKVKVLGFMTEPGENTTVFFIFASIPENNKHSWVLIKVDFKDVFERNCTKADYKWWSPYDSKPGRQCLLGQKEEYERRDPSSRCYNGQGYERPIVKKICTCERTDFECDFGYTEDPRLPAKNCLKDNSETSPGVKAEWCKPGVKFYNKTKGYRKVPGDVCEERTEVSQFLPETIPCAVKSELEFMLVAKRDSVLRIDLNNFNRTETLPLPRVRSVIAVDFDMKNNCIFWSDVNRDHIMKLHLDGESEPELLVSSNLKSVEGLAYDWMAHTLYFSDGAESKIEVIRTDVHHLGRMRKKILGKPDVEKPRGIAVHPDDKYLFWTDWSADKPCIGRSNLDGSDVKRIVENKNGAQNVRWPNGITVDFNSKRLYWVDAFLDRMTTADFEGGNIKAFLDNDNRVNHPFAVGVYKNLIYWDDWTTRSIYFARSDVDEVKDSIFLVLGNQSRLMDLKVYGSGMQEGGNLCSGIHNTCSHLCLALPNNTVNCECPDGLVKSASRDTCLCPDGKPVKDDGRCDSYCSVENTFKCSSGFCVPLGWKCDGDDDCGDNSDEKDCDRPTCTAAQFQCNVSGKCIPEIFRCDYDHDCGGEDDSDERGCEGRYPKCDNVTHFQCDNGRCILQKWHCDFEDDCGDGGSDERNCTTKHNGCGVNEYKCLGEDKCLSLDWVCDGDRDCASGSDEANCTIKTCPEWKFHCGSGQCIMKSWECDGDKDCPDGTDEHANCPPIATPPPGVDPFVKGNCANMSQMFECKESKQCIPVFWRCDGAKDCQDGSDELGCGGSSEPTHMVTLRPAKESCPIDSWRCNSGDCIAVSARCDTFVDCPGPDNEDEADCDQTTGVCQPGQAQCGMSKVCVLKSQICDGRIDCPNKMDESACHKNKPVLKCNSGEFKCDDECKPMFKKCNGKMDCFDGQDEAKDNCTNHQSFYQVAGMSLDRELDDAKQIDLEWWVDPSLKGDMEFLPSYCEIASGHCINATKWTRDRRFTLGQEKKLLPYTKYSVTVYVSKDGRIYPPAVYKNVTSSEAIPGKPFGLNVKQRQADELTVSWKKPTLPNGKITGYTVFFSPPSPPVNMEASGEEITISNKRSDPIFRSGMNYTFWVQAHNHAGESDNSETFSYVYNADVAMVSELKIKDPNENSVTVMWKASNKNVDYFVISLETAGYVYSFKDVHNTNKSMIQFLELAPKTEYKVTVLPVHKDINGNAQSVKFTTKGEKLPRVKGLKVDLSKKENEITVSWSPVQGSDWVYGIYYGKSTQEISSKKARNSTTGTSIVIKHLDACELYLIDVGLIGPLGNGPLTDAPLQVTTRMDEKAPPKDVRISEKGMEMKVMVTWKAPCPDLYEPLSYNITLRELTKDKVYGVSNILNSTEPELSFDVDIRYGGRYELNVSTSVEGARPSIPVIFEGPAIPYPEQVDVCRDCHPLRIFWAVPPLPKLVTKLGPVKYKVWVSKDQTFDSRRSTVNTFETNGHFYPLDELNLGSDMYFVAVSVTDGEGLESPRSSPVIIEQTASLPQIMLSTNKALAIVLTVIIVIVVLVAILGIFVIRHKRLQSSFLNFASSHYSTHSGAATFQQNMEEQDSPVIRGFSDDEPLLVA